MASSAPANPAGAEDEQREQDGHRVQVRGAANDARRQEVLLASLETEYDAEHSSNAWPMPNLTEVMATKSARIRLIQ